MSSTGSELAASQRYELLEVSFAAILVYTTVRLPALHSAGSP